MNKEILNEITNVIKEGVPEVTKAIFEKEYKAQLEKQNDEIENLKTELKTIKFKQNTINKGDEKINKKVLGNAFKKALKDRGMTEEGFKKTIEAEVKTLTEGTSGLGAELVFAQFEKDVLRVLNSYDVLKNVKFYNITKGDKLSIPKIENGVITYYVNEGANYTASDLSTSFITIDIAKVGTLVNVSEELLDDTMTSEDVYDLIVEQIGQSQAYFIEDNIFKGTGAIRGILTYDGINKVETSSTSVASIDYSDLNNVVSSAKRKFTKNTKQVKWYMSQYVFTQLKSMVDANGNILFPSLLQTNPTLLGYSIVLTDSDAFVQSSAQEGNDKYFLLFGDLNYYIMVRRKGITVENGYYSDNWSRDIKSIKANQRLGGDVAFPEAFTVLKAPSAQ